MRVNPIQTFVISCTIEFAELFINHGADLYAKARFLNDDMTPLDMTTSPKCKYLNKMIWPHRRNVVTDRNGA